MLCRRGRAQGGMELATRQQRRGGSVAEPSQAVPLPHGFSTGAAVSDPRVELGLFEHHHLQGVVSGLGAADSPERLWGLGGRTSREENQIKD